MASLNLNKVVLAGHLTATPELRRTPTGLSVTSFSIAINRRSSKNAEGAQNQQNVDFINIVAWNTQAEFITRYFKKGSAICITGRLQTRNWTDQQTNTKRYATEVVVDEAYFVDSNGQGGMGFSANQDSFEQSAPQFSSMPGNNGAETSFEDVSGEDDLPF